DAHRASGDHEKAIKVWKTETLPVYKDELDSGIADEAEMYSKEALEMRFRLLGEHQDTARSYVDLSDILIFKQDFKSATEQLEEAIEIQKKVLGEEHETTKRTLEQLRKLQSMVE
ncbi:unnamed protein product, partial [Porites evermanni]